MKCHFVFVVLTLFCFASAARADLGSDVGAVLADPQLSKAHVSLEIVRLGKNENEVSPILQNHATDALIPASNLKLVTTSAAMEKLGPGFIFKTRLIWHDGDLILIGDGDPTLGDAELLRRAGWDADTVFKAWAAALAKRQMNAARDVIVDDSVFELPAIHPNWPADQYLKRYMAEVSGLNFNANCIDFYTQYKGPGQLVGYTTDPATTYINVKNTCVGGDENAVWLSRQLGSNDITLHGKARSSNEVPIYCTIHDPALYAGTALSEIFKAQGIAIAGAVKRDRSCRAAYAKALAAGDKTWVVLAVHETPLTSVMSRANKDSMNLYAECLCKRMGYAASGEGTWASGTAQMRDFLASLKIPAEQFSIDDGCGLSKKNAISSAAIVKILAYDYYSKNAKAWMATLAVAGEEGTLLERFRGTDLRGHIIGKTGFVNGVSCLSGYLHARDDNWYCFSIMFNGIAEGTNSGAKILQEKIVRALDRSVHSAVADRN